VGPGKPVEGRWRCAEPECCLAHLCPILSRLRIPVDVVGGRRSAGRRLPTRPLTAKISRALERGQIGRAGVLAITDVATRFRRRALGKVEMSPGRVSRAGRSKLEMHRLERSIGRQLVGIAEPGRVRSSEALSALALRAGRHLRQQRSTCRSSGSLIESA